MALPGPRPARAPLSDRFSLHEVIAAEKLGGTIVGICIEEEDGTETYAVKVVMRSSSPLQIWEVEVSEVSKTRGRAVLEVEEWEDESAFVMLGWALTVVPLPLVDMWMAFCRK